MAVERKDIPRPEEFSFDADPFKVEEEIKGATIMVGDKTMVIKDAKGFTRKENEERQYRVITKKPAGVMVGVPYRNIALPLITTAEGSCVKLQTVEFSEPDGKIKRVDGPGNVAKVLGLEKHDTRQVVVENPYTKVFRLVSPEIKPH